MKPYFADTWFFLALLNPDDSSHSSVRELVAALDRRVMTSDWIVVEVGDALSAPPQRHLLGALTSHLSGHHPYKIVGATRSQVRQGSELFMSRPDKAWSLTDCISFELMRRMGLEEALTADHHFEQAGFRAVFKR